MFLLLSNVDDPNFRNAKPNHRDYMHNRVKMVSVVPFRNTDLLKLCIITQRIEYLRECVLLPYLNDYSFSFTSIVSLDSKLRLLETTINALSHKFSIIRRRNSLMTYLIISENKMLWLSNC